jgi:hypothetical protein
MANDPVAKLPFWRQSHRPSLVFHWRRNASSRAALHRRETERLAIVRHPRILPWPATTPWQRRAASLSHLRPILFASAAHLVVSCACSLLRHSSMLFACTGAPLHRFFSSWPQANGCPVFFRTALRLSGIEMGSRNEDRSREKPRDHRDGTKADSPLHHFLFQTFSSWGRENVVLAIAQRGLCVALEALAAESVTKIAARRI